MNDDWERVISHVPNGEVERLCELHRSMGATKIDVIDNGDGTSNIHVHGSGGGPG